jgi:hypothetical protein
MYWYEGGIRPFTPEQLELDKKPMPATGTMFIGDKGIILGNQLIPEKRMREYLGGKNITQREARRGGSGDSDWIQAFKGGKPSPGNFLNAAACSEAIALAGVAIRYSRKYFNESRTTPPLEWDAQNMKITNIAEANQYLVREYRKGWEL